MKKLLEKLFVSRTDFCLKAKIKYSSISHLFNWSAKKINIENRLRILSATKKQIKELTKVYKLELDNMKEELWFDFEY